MKTKATSIRPFVGSKDFDLSRKFYAEFGFQETVLAPNLSVFKMDGLAFYLQAAYVRDWVDNTMIFVEVESVDAFWKELTALDLTTKYESVKLTPAATYDWGRECFVHDPSGVLWHFGEFY